MSATLDRLIRTPALRAYGETLARHLSAYWVLYGVVLATIAAFNSYFAIGVNATPSLAYTICFIAKGDLDVRRGDLVAFRWHGGGPVSRRGRLHQDRARSARRRGDPRGAGRFS